MAKTAWDKLLVGYKGRVADYGALVRQCIGMETAGANVEQILMGVAMAYPSAPTVEIADKPLPYAVFTMDRFESGTYDQMDMVARLPVFVRGALMPDAHPGYAMPIGGVAGLRGGIAPNLVGVDIGCRVSLSLFDIPNDTFTDARPILEQAVIDITAFGFKTLDAVQDHPVMHDKAWNEIPFLRNLKDKAQSQLGTSGGGNHFVDLVKVWDDNGAATHYAIMTHSGSRGAGAQAAKYYSELAVEQCKQRGINVPKDYAYLDANSLDGQEYWRVMNLMGEYSLACHELIIARFYERVRAMGIELAKYFPGQGASTRIAISQRGKQKKVAELIHYFTNAHNLAWIEKVDGEWLYVHRKGATPAAAGQVGIIPGSSGSNSYVVIGQGNNSSLNSASHGAGRPRSRTASKALHDNDAWLAHMEGLDIHYHGVAPDETVFAYKDIESVMDGQKDLVRKWMTMRPFFVAMGGHSDDGD